MQKTAYEMRISDWSSDVCSSDLTPVDKNGRTQRANLAPVTRDDTLQKGHIGGQIMASGGKLANAVRGSHQHHVAAIDARTGIDAPEAGRRAGGGIPDETRCGINREIERDCCSAQDEADKTRK